MYLTPYAPRAGRPPSRFLLIPIGLILLVIAAFIIAEIRANARLGAPPALRFFDGLPVTGSIADAHRQGFTRCIDFITRIRCRRAGVMLLGHGPFEAAVDLQGRGGRGGFRQLTLWHDTDPRMASDLARDLERRGWQSCLTMLHNWGDQNILRRTDTAYRVSVDLSYYSKRRVRVIPENMASRPHCE